MNLRNYNIYYHTHTISGICIAALLYVIFFAGSFSFFKDEISAWQKNESHVQAKIQNKQFDLILDSLNQKYQLKGRSISFNIDNKSNNARVNMSSSLDSSISPISTQQAVNKKARIKGEVKEDTDFFYYNFQSKQKGTYLSTYDLGEFMYRLHFLAQLNAIPINFGYPFGYLIAGLVAFLFLFALITGILVHWNKIVSNFFLFRPWQKWKTVWSDMHTALGVIGFPFQLVYAITGVILICNFVLINPYAKYLYAGESEKLFEDLEYQQQNKITYLNQTLTQSFSVEKYLNEAARLIPNQQLNRINIQNYGDKSMLVTIEMVPDAIKQFAGNGMVQFDVYHDKSSILKSVQNPSYLDRVKALIYRLHYGNYGGYGLKVIYFLLGMTACFVLISGILIWLVARDKSNVPAYKRKFNFWASNVFISIALTMFPVTAFTFIMVKLNTQVDQAFIYRVYFISWLVLSLFYILRKNLNTTNRETLLLGSILAVMVPLANVFKTGKGILHNYRVGAMDLLIVDLLWLFIGLIGLIVFYKLIKNNKRLTEGP